MLKLLAHIKWFFAVIPLGLISFLSAPIIYPIAYYLNKKGLKVLTWWLDDEINNSATNKDWIIYCNGNVDSFKYLYKWHALRNSMWNLKRKIKPAIARINCKSNNERIVYLKQDLLYRNGLKVDINSLCFEQALYKWIDKNGNEGWQVFSGDKISLKYSTIGVSEYWYTANDNLYYRYSIAKEIKILWFTFYYEFRMGATDKGYLLVFKLNKK